MALGLEPKCHCARKGPAVGNSIKSPWRRRPRRFLRVSSWVQTQPALLLPPLRTNHRSVSEHRRKPRPKVENSLSFQVTSRRSAVNLYFASTRNANAAVKPLPQRRRPRRFLRVSSWVQAQPALLLPPLWMNHRSVSEHRRKPRPKVENSLSFQVALRLTLSN